MMILSGRKTIARSFLLLTIIATALAFPEPDEPQPPSSFSQSNAAKIAAGRSSMQKIKSLVRKMKGDSSTSQMIPGTVSTVTAKVGALGTKWKTQLRDAYNADSEGMAERIAGAISGVGTGIVGMANGIKNKDWKEGLKGALTIVSSLAQLAGPVGMIAASVLSFFSSMLDLFGGSAKTESMDDKIERIVKEQIDIGRGKDLKAEVEGVKLEFTSISTSLQHYRESKKLERNEATELYNLAFNGLVIFGKLRARVDEICDIDLSKDDAEKQKAAKKCLGVISLLAEVSILRQLIMADMASVLSDVHCSKHDCNDKSKNEEGGLLVVANNILNIVKKEQENDGNFISFLTDPFNNPKRRYISAIFFGAPSQYPTITSYIQSLDEVLEDGMYHDYVMLCQGAFLTGVCNVFEKKVYPDLNVDPGEWRNKVKSFFIPPAMQVTAGKYPNFDTSQAIWGPYVGPSAYELSSGQGRDDWDSIRVEDTERNALEEVRICEKKSLGPGRCHTLENGDHNLNDIGTLNFDGKVASMYIPYKITVSGHTDRDKGGNHYVYYIGEDTINEVFDHSHWKSIEIESSSTIVGTDASEQVKYCSKEDLKGMCRTTWISINGFESNFGMKFDKVQSLKIPGGLKVTGYSVDSQRGTRYGPYTGPALISKVDPIDKWKSMKVEEFGEEKTSNVKQS